MNAMRVPGFARRQRHFRRRAPRFCLLRLPRTAGWTALRLHWPRRPLAPAHRPQGRLAPGAAVTTWTTQLRLTLATCNAAHGAASGPRRATLATARQVYHLRAVPAPPRPSLHSTREAAAGQRVQDAPASILQPRPIPAASHRPIAAVALRTFRSAVPGVQAPAPTPAPGEIRVHGGTRAPTIPGRPFQAALVKPTGAATQALGRSRNRLAQPAPARRAAVGDVPLVWAAAPARHAAIAPGPALGPERSVPLVHAPVQASTAAVPAPAPPSPAQVAGTALRQLAATSIDPALAGRLADEVIRRVERSMRIERERRGH